MTTSSEDIQIGSWLEPVIETELNTSLPRRHYIHVTSITSVGYHIHASRSNRLRPLNDITTIKGEEWIEGDYKGDVEIHLPNDCIKCVTDESTLAMLALMSMGHNTQ